MDVARKCEGVPLVATVIGGTMFNKRDINEWASLRDSSRSGFFENEGIVAALRLSFDRLSSPFLKECFLYCSIFPKGFKIQKEQLIQLWMAEGLLQQDHINSLLTLEDIGNEYFINLLSNSLLQDEEKDIYGNITGCKMHKSIHDFAQSIRYLGKSNTSHSQLQNAFDGVQLWHSLFSKFSFIHNETDFKGLRVLNFSDGYISSLSESIGGLKHLRYFDISNTRIPRLPKSIIQLYHLQTLRLLSCNSLKKLPKGMESLIYLRHLCINDTNHVPNGIGCLPNLRTLPIFDVGIKQRRRIGELRYLRELEGELKISNLHNVKNKEEAKGAKIREKERLHKLRYEWKYGREGSSNDEEVLEGLEPHQSFKSLTIEYYMGENNPSWMARKSVNKLVELVELNLFDCEKLKTLSTLGKYPNLKYLKLWGLKNVKCIGNEFYMDNAGDSASILFPALEKLTLHSVEEVKSWLEVKIKRVAN
ncbi:hypothetical protein DITRI_Ditri15bG0017800 [Diplodiscus trichospermus]